MTTTIAERTVGSMLREWRERRRYSQLRLAVEAGVSSRHLSYVETGKSRPSEEMILRLAEHLDVPLRERNRLLLAGGYAPAYAERAMDSPHLAGALDAVRRILAGHEPYPALLVDRHWTMVEANDAAIALTSGVDPALLEPPVNVLRLSLHPDGLAPAIVNLGEWRHHLLDRLERQVAGTADPELERLLTELRAYPGPDVPAARPGPADVAVTLDVRAGDRVLSFVSTTTVFGTPTDVLLSELAVESFYPADEETARALRR